MYTCVYHIHLYISNQIISKYLGLYNHVDLYLNHWPTLTMISKISKIILK